MIDIYAELGVTRRYVDYLLAGSRNASPKLAGRLAEITGIPRELWVFGTAQERRAAWEKFKAQVSKRPETQEGEP